VEQHSWLGYYIAWPPGIPMPPPDRGSGAVPPASQQTLELRVSRFAGDGLHEDLDLTNWASSPVSFELAIEIDADFADLTEIAAARAQKGRLRTRWRAPVLDFDYSARHGRAAIHRGLAVRILRAGTKPRYRDGRLLFDVALPPRGSWHACIAFAPRIDGKRMRPLAHRHSDRRAVRFLGESTRFQVDDRRPPLSSVVTSALEQARHDLAALRLFDLDRSDGWTMAAGLPMYVALYGRDALTAGWQAGLLGPEMMIGALETLRRFRGRRTDDWRDEQPGRMLHEMHTGPLSALGYNPRGRSFSSTTTSALYPFIVAELWHWTGDKDIIAPFIEPALGALRWLDRHGDLDGDGFYEYKTRSRDGVRNQAWKDSDDAIVDEEANLVEPPIATCEEQGFVYISKLHFSEVLWWLGRRGEARALFRQAEELKRRFNDAFWDERLRFYALGHDAKKRRIRSVTSNPGHCVATAICDSELVEKTVDRLFREDIFSGWGIRTLSADHPAFNPYSYHRGSVWPVEHGTFALGFMRYGLHDRAVQLARAQFEAAALFDFYRLPELFSGHPRDNDHPFPAIYPNANSPQAWSASTVYCLLQAMLGLYPYAPLKMLVVDPHLPEWLPEITLRDLRIGRARVTIRFSGTRYRVLEKRGTLHVIKQPTPWSLTATFAERLRDWLTSLLPRR
jgi:glycogen debranching enzyme